jgi:hypothetical protein
VRLKNDIAFSQWCNANRLGEDIISKNERAALIKVGSDMPYWRARIVEAKGRSIRMIVENNPPPEVSQHRETSLPPRRKPSTASPQPAPKAALPAGAKAKPPPFTGRWVKPKSGAKPIDIEALRQELADADEVIAELRTRLAAWDSALAREGLSMREKPREVTAVEGLDRVSKTDETMVSVRVLIDQLTPIIESLRREGKRNMATASIIASTDAAFNLQKLLDHWASDDPTVCRSRGHAVPGKASAKAAADKPASDDTRH